MTQDLRKVADLGRRIAQFLAAPEWRALLDEKPNFWHILQIGQKYEVWYSRMLRWLMDPQENHGLGTWFLERVLEIAGYRGPVSAHARVTENLHHIDILVFDEENEVVLAIENKTMTRLHFRSGTELNQIDAYYELLAGRPVVVRKPGGSEDEVHIADYQAALQKHPELKHILLTPYGEDRPLEEHPVSRTYEQHWRQISYADLEPALEGAILRATWNHDLHTKKLIEDFYFDQRRKHTRRERDRDIADLFEEYGTEIEALVGHAHIADAIDDGDDDPDASGAEKAATGVSVSAQDSGRTWTAVTEAIKAEGIRLDEYELRAILHAIWADRPVETTNDSSKWTWRGVGPYTKREILHRIAQELIATSPERIETVAMFADRFRAEVLDAVGPQASWRLEKPSAKNSSPLIAPSTHAYSATDLHKGYRDKDMAFLDRMGAIELEGQRLMVAWSLGVTGGGPVGKALHLPVIAHFRTKHGYPIEPAGRG